MLQRPNRDTFQHETFLTPERCHNSWRLWAPQFWHVLTNPITLILNTPSMVPKQCRISVLFTMVSFKGCLILGGRDYFLQKWLGKAEEPHALEIISRSWAHLKVVEHYAREKPERDRQHRKHSGNAKDVDGKNGRFCITIWMSDVFDRNIVLNFSWHTGIPWHTQSFSESIHSIINSYPMLSDGITMAIP